METSMNIDAVKELLSKIPEPADRGDDFNACDWSGGNFDDAYALGEQDGERHLASRIRKLFG
jgi:hypothetical protein